MSAYIIVEIDIVDPSGYDEYKKLAGATVEKYGAKDIVRGGRTEVLEGDWKPKRIVVLEFASMQRAKEWLNFEERTAQNAPPHRQNENDRGRRRLAATAWLSHPVVGATDPQQPTSAIGKASLLVRLDAPSGVHNLKSTRHSLPGAEIQREYFSRLLSLFGWQKNGCRHYRHHFDPFCRRTFAW